MTKKKHVTQKLTLVLGRAEKIVGKGENAGHQHFLLFPQCFQKASFFKVSKNQDCVVKHELFSSNDTEPISLKAEQSDEAWKEFNVTDLLTQADSTEPESRIYAVCDS